MWIGCRGWSLKVDESARSSRAPAGAKLITKTTELVEDCLEQALARVSFKGVRSFPYDRRLLLIASSISSGFDCIISTSHDLCGEGIRVV